MDVLEPTVGGDVRYPEVKVALVGVSSHPFAIIGAVTQGMRRAGVSSAECDAFRVEALSGDYNHIIQTAMRWVDVE